ncbi:MAG: Smr/MutS family protein [Myxococcales bacterium]|nr:Smr/MutS family protein [Myxococcales bacterium]
MSDLGWPLLLDHWAKRCATRRGELAVRAMALFESPEPARARAAEISEARHLLAEGAPLPVAGIEPVADAIERVRKAAALDAPELVSVARTGRALSKLRAHCKSHSELAPRLWQRGQGLADLSHVYLPILEAFDPEGRLVDHASDALGPLRRALAAIKVQLEKRMKGLLEDERFSPYLQDTYYTQREDRYVLPVRTDGKGFVRGIVHGTSQSGQTLFIEPDEIVDLNNKMKLAECDVLDEERRILIRFSGWVAEEAAGFADSLEIAEVLDVIAAAARLAEDLVAAEPVIADEPKVALLHARHPLMLLAQRRCVANDVTVAAGSTLVISGPNAGGKTVALKTVGLCALMARLGLHLPAEGGSVMGWFTEVRTDIGDAQSLEQNLSTFSGHMVNVREFLDTCGPGSLVLVDEIAVGTDPEQGAALAQAVLEALAQRGVTAIVTTHYERLKALGATDPRFANASVGFDLSRLEPTFKLHLGIPGSSGALAMARRMGVAAPVVDRATALLGGVGAKVEDLLANVLEQQRRLESERAALLAELEAAEADRLAAKTQRERLRARLERETRAAHGEAVAALRVARREIEEARKQLKLKLAQVELTPEQAREELRSAGKQLGGAAQELARHEPARPRLPGRASRREELVVGALVIVPRLGRAEVASVPAADADTVEVRLGPMRAFVPIADVLIDTHRTAARAQKARGEEVAMGPSGVPGMAGTGARAAGASVDGVGAGAAPGGPAVALVNGAVDGRANARTPERTLDVRGMRADEAVSALDRFIDESLLADRDAAFIIHGHGTGALKQAVRQHAKGHKAITRFRPGEAGEGGDGVTVLLLGG